MVVRTVRSWACGITCAAALGATALIGAAQLSRSTKQPSELRSAITHLVEEAQFAIRDGKLHHEKADYARRFPSDMPLRDLCEAIAAPVDADAFIDAYVRWQLTSFEPSVPDLTDNQFLTLIANAPAMIDDPRADADVVSRFEQAEKAARPTSGELEALRRAKDELHRRVPLAESFNRPAIGYREWLIKQFEASRVRRYCLLIEECAATIKAGRPTRAIKSKLTKATKQAGDDSSITPQDRQLIAQQLQQLTKIEKRRAVNEITFPSKGGITVTFTNIQADQDDVNKWIAQLNGNAP